MKTFKCSNCNIKKNCNKYFYSKNNDNQQSNAEYFSLSPFDRIVEKDDVYKKYYKAFDFALKNRNVHNVAITGNYGSGKSSVIDSYFKNICCKSI